MFAPVRTAAPAAALVTLAEAKAHLRIEAEATDEDDLVSALIDAATEHLDGWAGTLGRALVTQTWRQDFRGFCDRMRLPLRPAVSVTAVAYYDADDAAQTLSTAAYALLADADGPYVARVPAATWPAVSAERDAPVSITYVAGYGDAADVPRPIRQAALLMIGHLYENREAVVTGTIATELPMAVSALVAPFRCVAR